VTSSPSKLCPGAKITGCLGHTQYTCAPAEQCWFVSPPHPDIPECPPPTAQCAIPGNAQVRKEEDRKKCGHYGHFTDLELRAGQRPHPGLSFILHQLSHSSILCEAETELKVGNRRGRTRFCLGGNAGPRKTQFSIITFA
jgi:hypothetical protein